MAEQYKRRGQLEDAQALWRELSDGEGAESVLALTELSMVAEHRDKDFAQALVFCEAALSKIESDHRLSLAFRERQDDALRHRKRRLQRRHSLKTTR